MNIRQAWDRQVRERANHPFLVWECPDMGEVRTFTYAAMDSHVWRVASLLRHRGVGFGDRVVVQMCNEVEFIQLFLAVARIGAVVVPMSPTYTPDERDRVMDIAKPVLLVCPPEAAEDLGRWKGATLVVGRDALEHEDPVGELPDIADSDLVEIMFTSGTTGDPKGVMITHANATFSGSYVMWELGLTAEDRYLSTMVATHVNLQLSALMPVIAAGATLTLESRYSAHAFWASVRRHRATVVQGMAMIVRTMMLQPTSPDDREHCVRAMHYFLPLSDAERQAFIDRFNVPLLNNYGSTECLVGAVTDYPDGQSRWPSVGKAGPGYEVRVVKADGVAAGVGEHGEIQIKGVPGFSLMAGYYGRPDLTDAAIRDGWFHTGDCGYMDADGWVYFIDRYTDVIKRSGVNISALEVEQVLASHPAIRDVAVVAVPDPVRDQAVKAVVVPRDDARIDSREVTDFAAERLAPIKVPTIVEFRRALPRGEYGKVLKRELVAPLEAAGTTDGEKGES